MKKTTLFTTLAAATVAFAACAPSASYYPDISTTASPKGTDLFQPDSASIAQNYTIPDWFTDSKLGIFIHYGV